MKARVAVIGDGGWGTALAVLLHGNGHDVTVWGPFPDYLTSIVHSRENSFYLPGVKLPHEIVWTSDRAAAVESADIVVLAVPTKFFRDTLVPFASLIPKQAIIVSVAKGFDQATHKRMTQVAEEVLGHTPVAALSGPSFADEVARGVPTAVCVACADIRHSHKLQNVFSNSMFRVYSSDDVAGVEYGGALKNIIAIAAGVSDGIGFGDNSKAALMTRGLAEMTRFGVAMGAKHATFMGLSGMGDLIVTCGSRQSRNRTVGEMLGRGEPIDRILAGMKQVAEGVLNCRLAHDVAREKKIAVPITDEVYSIIYHGKNPLAAVTSLMTRDLKSEY